MSNFAMSIISLIMFAVLFCLIVAGHPSTPVSDIGEYRTGEFMVNTLTHTVDTISNHVPNSSPSLQDEIGIPDRATSHGNLS